MNTKTTHKKVKVIGTKNYIDSETGELRTMQVIDIEDRDFNFTKVWMSSIINSLDLLGTKRLKLAFWIIEHLNKENQLIYTQRQMAEAAGISLKTVSTTVSALIDANFLQRINTGAYRVNPDVLFKGTHNARMAVLFDYSKGAEAEKAEKEAKTKKENKDDENSNRNMAFTEKDFGTSSSNGMVAEDSRMG